MNEAIWDNLTAIFRDILDDESIVLAPATTAKDVPGWDSITHVLLVVAIEKKFGVKFTAGEIQKMQNVGELVDLILVKKG